MKFITRLRRMFPVHSDPAPDRVVVNVQPPANWPTVIDPRPYDSPPWRRLGLPDPLYNDSDRKPLPIFLRKQAG